MAQGPSLIFDKSTLESLNFDEAVMMDNFYMSTMSTITPLFFVECRSKSPQNRYFGASTRSAEQDPGMYGHSDKGTSVGRMAPGRPPASDNRFGTATWSNKRAYR